jgi:multicomponent K+:H+ antiporter subunit D
MMRMSNEHLIVAPIVLPLLAGALLLLLERRAATAARRRVVAGLSVLAMLVLLATAVALLVRADGGTVEAYLLGNWRAPFGIALAHDRLSALMLVLSAMLGLVASLYASGGDDARGAHFHPLLQFQLMGVNGAFLTADLFNLFVFFEVLLIASYGLLLHGAGAARVKAAVHYVVFNLAGSVLFLFAVATLYGVTGTLSIADLAQKVPQLQGGARTLAAIAGLLLLVVFAIKAALAPLYLWLPSSYGAATAPVAAFFAIMTKVGVYSIARVFITVYSADSQDVLSTWQAALRVAAVTTVLLAALGALAAERLRHCVAYVVVASAGLLLIGVGLAQPAALAAALFYLPATTVAAALMFLLVDRIAANRGPAGDRLRSVAVQSPAGPEQQRDHAMLRVMFFAGAIALVGLPPLAGFLGKALLLQAAWAHGHGALIWVAVLTSSLLLMMAAARAGSVLFWKPSRAAASGLHAAQVQETPAWATLPTQPAHRAAIFLVAAGVVICAAAAGPIHRYAQAAAAQLFDRASYTRAVLGKQPVAPVWDVRREMRERVNRGEGK